MRIGVNLGPTANWPSMLAAARTADALGFETLGFLDHYHAPNRQRPYILDDPFELALRNAFYRCLQNK